MRLTFGDMTKEVNVFNFGRQPRDINDQTFEVNSIENLTSEHEESMEIKIDAKFDLKAEDFNLDQIVAFSPSAPHHGNESSNITSNEATPSLELKALPEHLKYAYLGGRETLPVIIASHLIEQQEDSLMSFWRNIGKPLDGQ